MKLRRIQSEEPVEEEDAVEEMSEVENWEKHEERELGEFIKYIAALLGLSEQYWADYNPNH